MDLLAEIRAAFPVTPYPGDHVLSNCWCEECAWSVRNLRGKSWKQVQVEDFNAGDGGHLSVEAFRYYLPALMIFAVQYPDELHFASEVNARFVSISIAGASTDRVEAVKKVVARLSKPQRSTIVHFLRWLNRQGWQAPVLIDAAITAVSNNEIEPVDAKVLTEWARAKQAEMRKA